MSSQFLQGAIFITVAAIISKIAGSIFRIPLQNIAGDEVLGIFTIVYPVYMSVLILTVAGIPLAISKLITEARAQSRFDDISRIYQTSRVLAVLFGVVSFTVLVTFADELAVVLGGSFAYYPIIAVSITLLVAPYMAVYRGYFQGFEQMKPTAVSQVLEQIVRVFIILVAAYLLTKLGQPTDIVASGVMAASVIGVVASLIYLTRLYRKEKTQNKSQFCFSDFRVWSKRILKISLPICVGALTMALLTMVDSLTVPLLLQNSGLTEAVITYVYGIYGRGLALVQIAVVFASALVLPLIPAISAHVAKKSRGEAQNMVEKAIKFTYITTWPAVVGLVVLTWPINLALFTDLQGNIVLAVVSASALFTAFALLTTGILQGMNKANEAALLVLGCALIKAGLNAALVPMYGITGAAISTLLIYILLVLGNVILMRRTMFFRLVRADNGKIVLSAVVMGMVIGAPLLFLSVETWTRLHAALYVGVMVVLGAIVYFGCMFLLKALSKEELEKMPVIKNWIR